MRRQVGCFGVILAVYLALSFASGADAELASPVWRLSVLSQPTNLEAGTTAPQGFIVRATNVGGTGTNGDITLTDRLPDGISLASPVEGCEVAGQVVSCEFGEVVNAGESLFEFIPVTVSQTVGPVVLDVATVLGGEAKEVEATAEALVGGSPPAFGFLAGESGLGATLSSSDGGPVSQAGSEPYLLLTSLGFPTELFGSELVNAGRPRDIVIDLPQGFSLDPAADPRCREAKFEERACPVASQVGRVGLDDIAATTFESAPLYNMVPPPGYAANLGFRVGSGEIAVHLLGTVRNGDYGLSAGASELLTKMPISALQLQIWGDPSDPSHDAVRGGPVETQSRPFITLPSACGPLELSASTDSWEDSGTFVSRSVPIESLGGDPLEVEGCAGLSFEPALSVQPAAISADSPYGPQVKLEMPQHLGPEGSTTSDLRSATVTLPSGTVLNPAAAGGLAACSPQQVGLVSEVGRPDARFDGNPSTCPDASKLGTVEALTPLLQDEPEERVQIPHPLTGSIYLAQPHQNPFGSLFALYAVVEDPARGIVVKLAGRVGVDPSSGQVTATFDEMPQVPFEEFKLDLFDGPQAPLRTPAVCGSYSARGEMAPWSGTAAVGTESSFSIANNPAGGECATSAGRLPNAPSFDAGSVLTGAGRYSPFVLTLSRNDGSQEVGAVNVTLPLGLAGRLAGTSSCSDVDLAAASPSCPAASRLGRAVIDLGAGTSPIRAEGQVYLAGPYRGAPLSLAVVTPAIAGPFDLGTVVVRAAVSVDPATGQVSAKSDPLPTILDGVPLDIRSIQLELDKPDLIRNPTSCEPVAVTSEAISTLGQVASLRSRFQVGDCAALPFRPKLSLKLSGGLARNGHPAVRAELHANPSGATLQRATFTIPRGELLALHNIRELCPPSEPVGQCPQGSRLGWLRLWTPLLEAPLEGAVYLRVPRRGLPYLGADLRSGGLSFVLSGQTTDSGGRLGVSLRSLPDIPISGAILTLSGGRRGILVNSQPLCGKRGYAAATFSSHDDRHRRLRVPVKVRGCD